MASNADFLLCLSSQNNEMEQCSYKYASVEGKTLRSLDHAFGTLFVTEHQKHCLPATESKTFSENEVFIQQ